MYNNKLIKAKWVALLGAIILFLAARSYPIDLSLSGIEQRLTELELHVDSLELQIISLEKESSWLADQLNIHIRESSEYSNISETAGQSAEPAGQRE